MTACKSNLKNLGTALEVYSMDFQGLYPENLSMVTPKYLKTIPICPAALKDTYSGAYTSRKAPDLFTMICQGQNHQGAGVTGDYPQYTSVQGLIERP